MNRHFDPKDGIVSVSHSETDSGCSLQRYTPDGKALLSGRAPTRSKLRGIIRARVFPRARQQLAEKRIMQIDRPNFPPKAIDAFVNSLLRTGDRYSPTEARDCLQQVGTTVLDRALFIETVAREIGQRWREDSCDFVETSIVAARLQLFVHQLENEIPFLPERPSSPTVLIASLGAEHHTLMNGVLGLLYMSLGWRKKTATGDLRFLQSEITAKAGVDIACISWSSDVLIEDIKQMVRQLMELPDDLRPVIIVGGAAAEKHVNELLKSGVDCICDNVYAAVNISERYIYLCNSDHKIDEARRFLNSSIHLDARAYE